MNKSLGERIADALVEDGLLTGAQVDELMEKQKKEGTRFIRLVVEKAYVSENDLVVSMGRVLNTPPVNVSRMGIQTEVAELVPREMASNYKVLPVSRLGNRLYLAMADPLNVLAVDDVKRTTKLEVSPLIASEKAIVEKLANLDSARSTTMEDIIQDAAKQAEEEAEADNLEVSSEAAETTDLAQLAASSEEAPVIKLANLILVQAIKDRASDIHIEPFENMVRLRYRIDGALLDMPPPPKNLQVALASRIKVMSSLDIAERRLPQDGRMRVRVGGRDVDLRVSFLPTVHGEKCVLRVLDKSNLSASMDKLGIDAETFIRFKAGGGRSARLDPGHRPDRLGQNHHALFGPQRAEWTAIQHRHGGRPGGIPASGRQPGSRQEGNRLDVRQRPPLHPAPGPGHHHDRGNPRHRDGGNRGRIRADRPPGLEHHALQRRAGSHLAPG